MAKEEIKNLAEKLKTDSSARASFIKDMKGVLQSHGFDVHKAGALENIGLTEDRLKNIADRASSAIITITH